MSDERFSVLHIVHRLHRAGSMMQATALAKHHGPSFRASVISLFSGGPLETELAEAGVPVEVLGIPTLRPARFWPLVHSILRQRQPDVVHAHSPVCARFAIPPAAIQKVPVRVIHARNLRADWSSRALTFERFVGKLATHTIANSDAVRRFYVERLHYHQLKTTVIRNGIDLVPFKQDHDRGRIRSELGVPPTALVICSVGSLRKRKDHALLIKVLPQIIKEVPQAVLVIAGDGPERDHLMALAREGRVAHAVKLLGVRDDVPRLLAASDLFALPSKREGWGNVFVEAGAAGLPSVGTEVDGIPEVILDGQTGLLVPLGDPAVLADVVVKLLKDESLRRDMGDHALAQAQRYDIKKTVQEIEDLYLSVLIGRPSDLAVAR